MTAARYRSIMETWPYRHDLDQVVEAPDGTLAASALGWYDEVNRVGLLEPVGTDPRHGRRGLGAAVSSPACGRCARPARPERWCARAATPPDRYPRAAAAAATLAGYISTPQYRWGLHRVLDGIICH